MRTPSQHSGPVRLGVIGAGSMGGHHARTVASGHIPGLALSAICDTDPDKRGGFPDVPFFTESRALIHSGLVDAVLIATPHYSHTTIGIEALKAGLHVLVEKPISVHKADGEKLIAAHRNKEQVFAAMFNQRTDPAYIKIRGMVRTGELGAIQRIQWTVTDWFRSQAYYDSGGWRATWAGEGGGVLINQCVHNIDLLQWIFGMPSRLHAICRIGRHHKIEVEDEVTALMEYPDGTTAVLSTSTGEIPGVNRLEIAADRGRLVLENGKLLFQRSEISSPEYIRTSKEGYLTPPVWTAEIPLPDRGEQHTGILRNFADAILHGAPVTAPAGEGLHSVELINAMLMSSSLGRTIDLPIDANAYADLLARWTQASTTEKKTVPYHGSAGNYLVDC